MKKTLTVLALSAAFTVPAAFASNPTPQARCGSDILKAGAKLIQGEYKEASYACSHGVGGVSAPVRSDVTAKLFTSYSTAISKAQDKYGSENCILPETTITAGGVNTATQNGANAICQISSGDTSAQ